MLPYRKIFAFMIMAGMILPAASQASGVYAPYAYTPASDIVVKPLDNPSNRANRAPHFSTKQKLAKKSKNAPMQTRKKTVRCKRNSKSKACKYGVG